MAEALSHKIVEPETSTKLSRMRVRVAQVHRIASARSTLAAICTADVSGEIVYCNSQLTSG